jgi:hypothetical protein
VWWGSNAGFAFYGVGLLGLVALVAFVLKDSGTVPATIAGVLTLAVALVFAAGRPLAGTRRPGQYRPGRDSDRPGRGGALGQDHGSHPH